jgi:hypothetical protein
MSDERQQSLAVLITNIGFSLWASHYVAEAFPGIPGALNLQQWMVFWNKPIWFHWPMALVFLVLLHLFTKRLRRLVTLASLQRQQKEAASLRKYSRTERIKHLYERIR